MPPPSRKTLDDVIGQNDEIERKLVNVELFMIQFHTQPSASAWPRVANFFGHGHGHVYGRANRIQGQALVRRSPDRQDAPFRVRLPSSPAATDALPKDRVVASVGTALGQDEPAALSDDTVVPRF